MAVAGRGSVIGKIIDVTRLNFSLPALILEQFEVAVTQ